MKKKRYRSIGVKSIWGIVVHIALAMAAGSAAIFLAMYLQGINLLEHEVRYEDSSEFAEELYNSTQDILNWIRDVDAFSTEEGTSERVVDLQEILEDEKLTFQDISGLTYSPEDLEKWAESGWEYGSDFYDTGKNILVCVKPDGKYEYCYYRDFIRKIDSGQLRFVADKEYLDEYEEKEEDVAGQAKEELRYGQLAEGTEQIGIISIADEKGEEKYQSVYNYTGESIVEKYAPVGAESILEVLNTNSYWNDKIEEAFRALDSAIGQTANYVQVLEEVQKYQEGNTNLTYLYVNEDEHRIYTNNSDYQNYSEEGKALKDLKEDGAYMILRPRLSECETNLGYLESEEASGIGLSMEEWYHMGRIFSPTSENYVIAVKVDLAFPVSDTFAENAKLYAEYSDLRRPMLIEFALGIFLFLAGIIWLTAAAGKRPEDEEIHLCFFDRWFTEISACIVIAGELAGVFLLEVALRYPNLWNSRDVQVLGIMGALFGVWTAFWFLTGYLSLVRRIKAKILWKGSLLHWLLGLTRRIWRKIKSFLDLYAKNTGSKIKMTMAVGLFLLFQFLINAIIFSGGAVFLLLLIFADMALLAYIIRRAEGQERILEGLSRISGGELQYKIPLDGLSGEQKTMAEYINNIGSGLDTAVENSLKNERMKTELITNVSHDIKTPLTSIINYVDLLKRENFTDPKICGYLDILEEKAQRLKVLTEDVVEASKASTGNITLEMTDLDFVEMIHQVIGEFEEKFQEKRLTMMVHFTDEPSVIYADGQRMWRVLENIFTNVTKYAMEGTRVYAELKKANQKVIFSLKNISAQPLNFSADELTERFIRGDVSRNTEGSGLGLSIAKSLTELQGGEFRLYLDGDLFKVTITFAAR